MQELAWTRELILLELAALKTLVAQLGLSSSTDIIKV